MDKLLKIYTYVDGVSDAPFPNADAQIEIFRFNYDAKRMGGAPTISASVMYKDCLDKLWTGKEYVIYNGERYKLKQTPTSSKNNTDARYKHDLELVALRVVLDYVYFFDAVVENTPVDDKPVTNSTKVVFSGDIHEFAKRLNASLKYTKLDYSVVVDDGITSETKFLSFDAQPISSVLQEIYKQYEIPYYFVGNVIHIGFTSNAITKTFKYGANDALLSISKNNANNKIVNRCTGVGSSENIPYYYPNKHPLGIVDTYLNDELNNALVTNNEKFGAKVKNGTELTYTENKIEDLVSSLEIYNYETYQTFVNNYGNPNVFWHWTTITDFIYDDTFPLGNKAELGSYKGFNPITEKITFSERNKKVAIKVKFNYLLESLNSNTEISITAALKFSTSRIDYTTTVYIPVLNKDKGSIIPNEVSTEFPLNKQNLHSYDYVYVVFEIDNNVRFDSTTLSRSAELELTATTKEPFCNYAWKNESDKIVKLENYGLTFNGTPSVGDKITFQTREGSLIPFQNALMPPIYWQTKGAESFYNAINDTYISPETGKYYSFENEYSDENRREHKETFDYIKPSIEFVRNGDTLPINMFLKFAYDKNDSDEIDESTNTYIHPYFFAKLRKFNGENGFNLFDHSNEKGEMTISMTSGNCGACNFVIGVEENTKKNIVQVDDSGNLVYESGRVKFGAPQDKQNDTINNEVWIALKKDTQTFGMLLPNKSIYPKPCTSADTNDGDTFVITNISLPTSFIREAEERLKDEIIKYMKLNNSEKFTFSIKFSRIYLAENPNILAQLNENARIQIEYNGTTYELYVSSYQYKVANNEVLPEITVELADTLSTNENALQQAINAVEHSIMSSVGSIDFYKQGLRYFIRKDVEDWARGLLHLTKGATFGANDIARIDEQGNADFVSQIIRQYISTPQFVEGFAGTGFKLWLDENGKSNLTVDNITARETFRVFEMLVTKLRAVNGGLFVSAANGTIKEVVDSGEYYDIILENDNTFIAGDYMRCQVMSGLKMMDYWVEIYSVHNKTCRVLKSEFGDVIPLVGQDVVLDGSKNENRQSAIYITANEDGLPRIEVLNGISTKNHDGCLKTRLGSLSDIVDATFGGQLSGYGLYSDNAYLKGEFILKNGEKNIETVFAIQDGKIKSGIAQTQAEALRGKSLLYNSSFIHGLDGWLTSNEVAVYFSGNALLFSGNSVLSQSVRVSNEPIFDNVFFITVNNGWIKQSNALFVGKPDFDNTKFYPLYFSTNVRCKTPGVLTVKLLGAQYKITTAPIDYKEEEPYVYGTLPLDINGFVVKKPIYSGDVLLITDTKIHNLTRQESFVHIYDSRVNSPALAPVSVGDIPILTKELLPSNDFIEINKNLMWTGDLDFYLEFTGEADFYGITIYTEKTEVKYSTLFEQTDRIIRATAALYGEDDELLKESGLVIQPEGAGLYAKDKDGKQALIATYIDEKQEDGTTKSKILLSGDDIILEGDISANGNVRIDAETGALTAKKVNIVAGGSGNNFTAINSAGITFLGGDDKVCGYLKSGKSGWSQIQEYPTLFLSNGHEGGINDNGQPNDTNVKHLQASKDKIVLQDYERLELMNGDVTYEADCQIEITPRGIFLRRKDKNLGIDKVYYMHIKDDGELTFAYNVQ